jgi:hypothetical protein
MSLPVFTTLSPLMDTSFHSGLRKACPLVRANCTLHPISSTDMVTGSTIIRDTKDRRKAGLASLAYFY